MRRHVSGRAVQGRVREGTRAQAAPGRLARLLLLLALWTPAALAQHDPGVLLRLSAAKLQWEVPAEPLRIAGPIHFVGTRGLASWLIVTPAGHMLLNTGMPGSGAMIEASIRKLGFKPEDIKLLLVGHAHVDHAGGHAHMKRVSGAQVAAMAEEAPLLESGGRTDFHYAAVPAFAFEPVKVDRLLRDGEAVTLGAVILTARHTPGHTKGSTTWVTTVGRYQVVFPDGAGINPGYRVGRDPSYAGIADDFRRTFRVLNELKPDIWLAAHTDVFDFERKRQRGAWVDPGGYRRYVARHMRSFREQE
jgi:metallo-beta-lactamase class B